MIFPWTTNSSYAGDNRVPVMIQVDIDRFDKHTRQLYSTDWELLDVGLKYPRNPVAIDRPTTLDTALEVASALSHDFPICRVDLYLLPNDDVNPRRSVDMQEALRREKKARRTLGLFFPEERRYVERSGSERVNGRLKDEFGGRHVRVRGYDKVLAHLMFGMTVLTASQLMRLIVPPIRARLLRHHRSRTSL